MILLLVEHLGIEPSPLALALQASAHQLRQRSIYIG